MVLYLTTARNERRRYLGTSMYFRVAPVYWNFRLEHGRHLSKYSGVAIKKKKKMCTKNLHSGYFSKVNEFVTRFARY